VAADLPPRQRKSSCLTDAHRRLIAILAEAAVEAYLNELEATGTTEATADERQTGPA